MITAHTSSNHLLLSPPKSMAPDAMRAFLDRVEQHLLASGMTFDHELWQRQRALIIAQAEASASV